MSRFEVPVVTDGPFGDFLDISGALPPGTSLILLCQCTNSGSVPKSLLLPHQVYTEKLAGGEWVVFALGEAIPITAGAPR